MGQPAGGHDLFLLAGAGPVEAQDAQVAAVEVLDLEVVALPRLQDDLAPVVRDDVVALPVVDDQLAADPDAYAVVVLGAERVALRVARLDLPRPAGREEVPPALERSFALPPGEVDLRVPPLPRDPPKVAPLEKTPNAAANS